MLNRIKEMIHMKCPIRRKEFAETLTHVVNAFDGIIQTDKQHSQLESTILQELYTLKTATENKKGKDDSSPPLYA